MELPLFPLNTLLFPGMPLSLHIFEQRYKFMIRECLQNQAPFGVVLIKEGAEALGPVAQPFSIGCTARIVDVKTLDNGRMNIETVGGERFRILSLSNKKPYLVGSVELYPITAPDPQAAGAAMWALRPFLLRYLELVSQASEIELDLERLPEEPTALAYTAAYILQVPLRRKQQLLEFPTVDGLLSDLYDQYRREVALLQVMAHEKAPIDQGPFSRN
jgi:Lon protease-like protein